MRISTFTRYSYAVTALLSVATAVCLWLADGSLADQREAAHRQVELKQLGYQLAGASDYLTSEVRQYAVLGGKTHYDNYWREVKEIRTRDNVESRIRRSWFVVRGSASRLEKDRARGREKRGRTFSRWRAGRAPSVRRFAPSSSRLRRQGKPG